MKLSYSYDEVERWRDKVYRRTPNLSIKNEKQALSFINSVGFCLASRSVGLDLPNLWDAVETERKVSRRSPLSERNYYLSYAWEIHSILPNHNSVYYGKLFKRKPSLVSKEFLPYFYVLSERTGGRDEFKKEYSEGRLSGAAKLVMDHLVKSSPLTTKELRDVLGRKDRRSTNGLDKALEELHRKMFIARIVGNENKFGALWSPLAKCFPSEVRKARKISYETARYRLLEKYFQNQLISSIDTIQKVFGWSKRDVYHTLGKLIHAGVVTAAVRIDGTAGKYYCLVR